MKNKIVYLIGFMASGKTQLGKKIAKTLDYEWIDLDEYIAKKADLPVKNIFSFWGEDKFRAIERECLLEIKSDNPIVVSCGGGTPCYFNNLDFMLENGCTIFLQVPVGMLIQRLAANPKNRPLVLNKSETEIVKIVNGLMAEREPFYKKATITFYSAEESFNDLIDKIKTYMEDTAVTPN